MNTLKNELIENIKKIKKDGLYKKERIITSPQNTKINVSNAGNVSMTSFNQTFFMDNQWWRLISPILIHFSLAHLAFNCLWIYILKELSEWDVL